MINIGLILKENVIAKALEIIYGLNFCASKILHGKLLLDTWKKNLTSLCVCPATSFLGIGKYYSKIRGSVLAP